MCVTAIATVGSILTTAMAIGSDIADRKVQKKTDEYNKQIAINQIKTAQNDASNQRQIGIDKAREEKLKGIKAMSKLTAKNAANGFDTYSQSNLYNYQDINDEYSQSADDIINSYYQSASKIDRSANASINQYKFNESTQGLNSLGNSLKVANKWYSYGKGIADTYEEEKKKIEGGKNGSF